MTVGIVTGAARGMGAACARRVADMVDVLLVADRDAEALDVIVERLAAAPVRAELEPVALDVTERDGVARLFARAAEAGSLRAVAHSAGVSPTMGAWRDMLLVDLVGTALIVEECLPLATEGTAIVCFASMAPLLSMTDVDVAADAVLDDPLGEGFLERIREAVGPELEDSGTAYTWAKRGVQRLVRRQATAFGLLGARICSVVPGDHRHPHGQARGGGPADQRHAGPAQPAWARGRRRRGGGRGRLPPLGRGLLRHRHRLGGRRRHRGRHPQRHDAADLRSAPASGS